jgi:hypothetical protein
VEGEDDLHVLARRCPAWEVARERISDGWEYTFSSSGERVCRDRKSSCGGEVSEDRYVGGESSVREDSLFERPRTGRLAVLGSDYY